MTQIAPPPSDARRFTGFKGHACFVAHWHRRTPRGYSTHYVKEASKTINGHRLAFTLLIGAPVGTDMVLHRCGHSSCLNPHHLYLGGDGENLRDRLLHQAVRAATGVQAEHDQAIRVSRPRPVALSQETSRRGLEFEGCTERACVHAPWLASTLDGYLQLPGRTLPGDLVGAHRKVFELFHGPLQSYELVRHSCGDKRCVNPHHLFVAGTQGPEVFNQYDRRKDRPVRGPYSPRSRS